MIIDELFESPQQCPECGGISFSDLILAEKKDACYHKVKASAKVWPSAYASGRLVQCRKKGAANYGNKSEGVAEGKITLSTDPNWYGATVDNYQASGPVVNIPTNQLVGFEPDDKMNQPKSKVNVEKIVAGLKQGSKLPPLLVRKYKNGYQVLDGHHRFWAYKLLGIKSIPAQIVPDSDIEEISKQGVAEAGFPGAPDVEMPPMNPSGDPQRDKLKQEYMDLHREIKSLVDLQYRSTSDEQKMQAKARIEQLNDRADQIKAILEPRQPPNEWQKKTYGFDDNWNKVNQGVAEAELDEKSVSQAQFRTMAGAAHNPEFARKVGISQDVAQEFNQADKKSNYKKLPARATEGEQQKSADYRDPREVDYDAIDHDKSVARLKHLAGLGSMKTVYDPAKRQYRNMPTAVQPKK